jgi:nitrate reductase assembly molybdenum cofactor insertion protein NarJ
MERTHYHLLAPLFEYPDADYPQKVRDIKHFLDEHYSNAAAELERFLAFLPTDKLLTMQELFTRSFDVQAATTLDIGYVLFGDDYKRGEMLANLNREHLAAEIDCGTELADHLPNLLRLMAAHEDEELINDLASAILGPALCEMIREFASDRIEKRNVSFKKHYKTLIETPAVGSDAVTLYQFALKSLFQVLKQDFSLVETIPLKLTSDFLASVGRENEIEENANSQY